MMETTSQLPGDVEKIALYRSSDIYFCAFLTSLDIPLITTETERTPDGNKKVVFLFRIKDSDLQRFKSSFFGGTGTVKARRFVDNIRSLKSMCHTMIVLSLASISIMFCK